jgi:hypothetical protein
LFRKVRSAHGPESASDPAGHYRYVMMFVHCFMFND